MTIEQKKYQLIQEIIAVNQAEMIDVISDFIKKVTLRIPTTSINLVNHPNITERVDIEKIKQERPLIQLNMAEFAQEASELEWDKSINELLQELD